MNMGYCRFQNTLSALRDCYDYLYDDLEGDEKRAKERLIKLCAKIADEFSDNEADYDS